MIASAPGKVILFGEHAVVYDKLGIAGSIGLRSFAKVSEGKGISLRLKNLNIKKTISEEELLRLVEKIEKLKRDKDFDGIKEIAKDKTTAGFFVIGKVMEVCGFEELNVEIEWKVPKGLGSSSSTCSALVFAVSNFLGKKLRKERIAEIANEGDVILHGGTPSGIDANASTFGGYILYKKSSGVKPLNIDFEFPLIIVDSGKPANTAETVSAVRELMKRKKKFVERLLDRIEDISKDAIDSLKEKNLEKIGELMNKNHSLLRKLGVSTKELDNLTEVSLKNGVLGAKLTGGGGGGCVIVLAEEEKIERILKVYNDLGYKTFRANLGVEGVRLEI